MGQWVKVASAGTASTSGLVAPGNVSAITVSHAYLGDYSSLDAEGKIAVEIRGSYTAPSPIGTFKGVLVFIEDPDGSAVPDFTLDGNSPLDATEGFSGGFQPIDSGKFPYKAGETYQFVVKRVIAPPQASRSVRVYCASYSDEIENQLVRASDGGPTPSAVFTLPVPTAGPSGIEFASVVTGVSVQVSDATNVGGLTKTAIEVTFARPVNDPRWSGVWVYLGIDGDGAPVPLGVFTESPTYSEIDKPGSVVQATIWVPSFSDPAGTPDPADDGVNSLVGGVTPSARVTLGTAGGTLDLGDTIAATISAAMSVVSGVLGVAPAGITETLLANFAVSQAKLANAQIIDAARIVDAAVLEAKLGAGSVTTPKIAALAVTTAVIDNLAVTNGKIGNLAVTGAKIDNLAVGTLQVADAAITTAKIANLAVTNALIGAAAITDAKIQDATISSAKIASLDVSKLNAGTIAVAVTLTSPSLVITSGTMTINMDGTNFLKFSDSGSNRNLRVTNTSLIVENRTSPNESTGIASRLLRFLNSSATVLLELNGVVGYGEVFLFNSSGVQKCYLEGNSGFSDMATEYRVGGSRVVSARLTAVTKPSGGATIDTQARTAIDAIIDRMRATGGHGLIAD